MDPSCRYLIKGHVINIILRKTDTYLSVGILGKLIHQEEYAELFTILNQTQAGQILHLEVYDAEQLPSEIIHALVLVLERGTELKIITYHSLLAHSLMRLGFNVQPIVQRTPEKPTTHFRAVVLAGSANSLDKVLAIVEKIPVSDLSIFIVQHVLEDQLNLLDQLLKVRTDFTVLMPQHLMAVQSRTIYVAPQGHHMKVAHGLVYLTRDQKVSFARPSIDVLLESLALEYGSALLALLLCGYGSDGPAGCAAVRQRGGLVLLEDPQECGDACVLPQKVVELKQYDLMCKSKALASLAASAAYAESGDENQALLELFIEALFQQNELDFRGYQRESFKRRVDNAMLRLNLMHFFDFQKALFSDAALLARFAVEVSVGVTDFFRHPEQFQLLKEKILPYLDSFSAINIWSAGCSTGEEAYSLAIVLAQLGLLKRSRIYATDINHYFLSTAQAGFYPTTSLKVGEQNYQAAMGVQGLSEHFDCHAHFIELKEALKKNVLFYQHSLISGGVFNEFQLIVCRNVMIYFDAASQLRILQLFAQSLHRDGFLVLGPQDGLRHRAEMQGFIPIEKGSDVYRRPLGVA
jgi:chemotaxis protein methyltransferase CheR